uniref:Uncharacterized protein n=1 Tax=Tetraselmis sp. GSL018 TaxID=582737 RepID=A0A061RGC6_9CHLO
MSAQFGGVGISSNSNFNRQTTPISSLVSSRTRRSRRPVADSTDPVPIFPGRKARTEYFLRMSFRGFYGYGFRERDDGSARLFKFVQFTVCQLTFKISKKIRKIMSCSLPGSAKTK